MRDRLLLLAGLALAGTGCTAWRAESRLFDGGAETAYFREQEIRARRGARRPGAEPPASPSPALPDRPIRSSDPADRIADLLPPGSEGLLRAAADDEGAETALAASPLDLETVRALAAVRAPGARAARESWRAPRAELRPAAARGGLRAPIRPVPRGHRTGTGAQGQRGMTAEFAPWPSTVALRGEMAEAEVAMAFEEARAAAAAAVAAAEEAWFEQWHAEESLRLKGSFLEALRRMAEVAARRYATGRGMQEEQLRVEVEIAELEADLEQHRAERAMAVSKLNALLSRPAAAALPETAAPRFPDTLPPADHVETAAREGAPMARGKASAAREARVALRMGEMMIHGQPATGARLERGLALEAGADRPMGAAAGAPMAEASLLYGPEEAYLRELRLRVEAADRDAEAAGRGAESMAREAWTALDTALREVRVGELAAIPLARQAFEISGRAYETGSGRFADHIQAWWMYVEARHESVEARMRAGFARAALLRAAGTETTERPR